MSDLLQGGFDNGPLFMHGVSKPAPKNRGTRLPGIRRRARERKATPPWSSPAECRVFWERASWLTAFTGERYSVDHIVPMEHPLVCGLHCPANLRTMPLRENLVKGTRYWPDMWGEQLELLNG